MVKLAKKRNKAFVNFVVTPPPEFKISKTGVFNFEQAYHGLREMPRQSYEMLAALYLLSDNHNSIETNDELQLLAIKIFLCELEAGRGTINVESYRRGYRQYKGLLDSMWDAAKTIRRKEKKFGDPPYPTCDEMFKTISMLQEAGAINDDMTLNISKYDIAVMREQLKREGYEVPGPEQLRES